ncbi:hypothetical protein ACSBR1_039473 [Camellia fascicularis]
MVSSNIKSRPFAAICFCHRAAAHQSLGQIADAIADCSLAIVLDGSYSKEKVGLGSSADTGKGKSKMSKHVTHGYHLVKGKSSHPMEDYVVTEFKKVEEHELGLFAIFDGHLSHDIPDYLRSHLFVNILNEPDFWTETKDAVRRAYRTTDTSILDKSVELGKGGSTAVTAILIDCQKLVVANVGDSRAVACKEGVAKQLSVDHEPSKERTYIEDRGGFVSNFPGDVPRVDGQLAVASAFGDKSLKKHLSSEPDVSLEIVDEDTEFVILASDGIWKVGSSALLHLPISMVHNLIFSF